MSQRSPMNERYSTDKPKGTARKSASSAKPKREAAASVTIVSNTKTKAEKKAERKKLEAQQRAKTNKFYNPPTPEYKRMRKIWALFVVIAIACSVGSFFLMGKLPTEATTVILVVAYAAIFVAVYIDLVKIRRIRNAYAASQADSKVETRARKAAKAEKAEKLEKAAQAKEAAGSAPEKLSLGQRIKGVFK